MKRIEDYIEKVYKNFDEKDEETKILKEETKAHLLEEVEELKKQGLTEEESINRALSNFGSENAVIGEMNFILKRQHKYLNIIAKLALCVFVFAIIFRFIGLGYNIIHKNDAPFVIDYDKVFKNTSEYVIGNVYAKLESVSSLDENTKNQITQMLDNFNKETGNGIVYVKIEDIPNSNLDPVKSYEYKKGETVNSIDKIADYGSIQWRINYNITQAQASYDYQRRMDAVDPKVKIGDKIKIVNRISNYLLLVSVVLLGVYTGNKVHLKNSLVAR